MPPDPPAVRIFRAPGVMVPEYATPGAAGFDLRAYLPEPLPLPPGAIRLVPTGIRVAVPPGFEIQVRSRSGLAARHGVFCLNSPGTIDPDYRGEIQVILANAGREEFRIEPGMRIAQAVLARVERAHWEDVPSAEALGETERGSGGFGSTGTR